MKYNPVECSCTQKFYPIYFIFPRKRTIMCPKRNMNFKAFKDHLRALNQGMTGRKELP